MEKKKITGYKEAVKLLSDRVKPADIETVDLKCIKGRVLAEDIVANENVPSFDRSPFDGYAFRAVDSTGACPQKGITLEVVEDIRAGQAASQKVSEKTAIRLMTGAPLPEGADAICKYEDTDFTKKTVTLKQSYSYGENVIRAGEDICIGTVLAKKGSRVDTGLLGVMASLGIDRASVYKKPVAGIISTGDEVVDINAPLTPGKIRNSNRYTIASALSDTGLDTVYLGHASDEKEAMKDIIKKGLESCDVIVSTGGVSAGDFDIVPVAMEEAGFEILADGVKMKPGMACAYGIKDGKLMLALSGNPASSLTNLQCVCMPALKKLCGLLDHDHKIIRMYLKNDFSKKIGGLRFLRGKIVMEDGKVFLDVPSGQGNVILSSAISCNAYGMVTKENEPLRAGDLIEGFYI